MCVCLYYIHDDDVNTVGLVAVVAVDGWINLIFILLATHELNRI